MQEVPEEIRRTFSILDFGAGPKASHAEVLREAGFKNVTAYDLKIVEGIHDANALIRKYDVINASNVLNVQPSTNMLNKTLSELRGSLKEDGFIVANFPFEPRKGAYTGKGLDTRAKQTEYLITKLKEVFNSVERITVKGSKDKNVFKISRPKPLDDVSLTK